MQIYNARTLARERNIDIDSPDESVTYNGKNTLVVRHDFIISAKEMLNERNFSFFNSRVDFGIGNSSKYFLLDTFCFPLIIPSTEVVDLRDW